MIKVKYTPKGVVLEISHGGGSLNNVFTDPTQLDILIKDLQEARLNLVEHLARSAEEAQQQLWES